MPSLQSLGRPSYAFSGTASRSNSPAALAASDVPSTHRSAIAEAVRQLRSTYADSTDPEWRSSAMIGLCAQVPAAEGRLLEQVLRDRVASEPSLRLMEPGIALPILEDAERMLRMNEWTALTSLSVDADQRATRHYRPDLIVIKKDNGHALLIDVKRSLSSYSGHRQLHALKGRMLAAALVAPEILYRDHKRTMVTRTEAAIIDLANSRKSYGEGIYALSHLDKLLGIEGLAANLQDCRLQYRAAVDELLQSLAQESFPLTKGARSVSVEDDDTIEDDSESIEPSLGQSSRGKRRSAPVERIRTAPVGLATLSPTIG